MQNNTSNPLDKITGYSLIIMAVVQGYLLYFLHLSIDNEVWPATDYRWLVAFYTLIIALPLFFYLGVTRITDRRNLYIGLPLALVLFWLGWHLGWEFSAPAQMSTIAEHRINDELLGPFILSLGIAIFILAFLFRSWVAEEMEYNHLLTVSWQNALTLGLLLLFMGVFQLLLVLWGALFDMLGIDFFKDMFFEPAFIYPVFFLVGGMGLVLIRNRVRLIATVQFMCEVLIKALLPLVALIVLLFLAALPFTGVQRIWEAGLGSGLLMALSLILLFFFNAVLSSNDDAPPYPAPVRWFVLGVTALLPLISGLVIWALAVRIEQYGLTTSRLWAMVIQAIITLFTVSYAVIIIWKRRNCVPWLQKSNTTMACVITAVLLLVNTPILDLEKMAARSQLARLLDGTTQPIDMDVAYLRFELGHYGLQALKKIKDSPFAPSHPNLERRITRTLANKHSWKDVSGIDKTDPNVILDKLRLIPANANPPDDLILWLTESGTLDEYCFTQKKTEDRCHLVQINDLGAKPAWALYTFSIDASADVFARSNDAKAGWHKIGVLRKLGCESSAKTNPTSISNKQPLHRAEGNYPVYTNSEQYFIFEPTLDYYLEIIK